MSIVNTITRMLTKQVAMGLLAAALLPAASLAQAADAANIVQDPTAVGTPVGKRTKPTTHKFHLESVELNGVLDAKAGTTYNYWTFNAKVPGPMLRVMVGDTVEITMSNKSDSAMIHNVDLHAVWGQGGGAEATKVAPGEEKSFVFKALHPGLFVYHCATPVIPQHISSGMYGLILVEPKGGLPKVDREFYIMQGDIYATGSGNHKEFDMERMLAENPTHVVMNGSAAALAANPMKAKVGDNIRIFFGVGGPNLSSGFHVIGTVFDKVFPEGDIEHEHHNIQTTTVPPGGSTMVEMKLRVPAKYILVDHALGRLMKGNVAIIVAEGDKHPDIFREGKL